MSEVVGELVFIPSGGTGGGGFGEGGISRAASEANGTFKSMGGTGKSSSNLLKAALSSAVLVGVREIVNVLISVKNAIIEQFSITNKILKDSSKLYAATLEILDMAKKIFWKPFGDILGIILLPMAIQMMKFAKNFTERAQPILEDLSAGIIDPVQAFAGLESLFREEIWTPFVSQFGSVGALLLGGMLDQSGALGKVTLSLNMAADGVTEHTALLALLNPEVGALAIALAPVAGEFYDVGDAVVDFVDALEDLEDAATMEDAKEALEDLEDAVEDMETAGQSLVEAIVEVSEDIIGIDWSTVGTYIIESLSKDEKWGFDSLYQVGAWLLDFLTKPPETSDPWGLQVLSGIGSFLKGTVMSYLSSLLFHDPNNLPTGGNNTYGNNPSRERILPGLDDFIMRPGQAPIAFNPQDTIIGFKGGGSPSGGGVTINVNNPTLLSSTMIGELKRELSDMVFSEIRSNITYSAGGIT